jgi:hypothetical protein
MVLSDIKRLYDLTTSNKHLTVYWVSCNCLYIKPVLPASPGAVERMGRLCDDLDEHFPGLVYEHRAGNTLRVEVKQ